ncbi:MAG: hypothetical protein IJU19_06295 [Bacteroidales bacterium]|nr:hypothetical protein [Bacteroidales bacterium]
MTTEERYRAILSNHLPAEAVDWVYGYVMQHKMHFHIKQRRSSKLGDYRWPQPRHPYHEISVNGDLSPMMFFWVFLHEAAHLETHLLHSHVLPHGHEWQAQYARLLSEHVAVFPAEVRDKVARYASRVPLNRVLGRDIEAIIGRRQGEAEQQVLRLDDLPAGSCFRLAERPSLLLKSLQRRRSRWLCEDAGSGRKYSVSARAEVVKVAVGGE